MKKLLLISAASSMLTFINIVNIAPAQAATFDDVGKLFGVLGRYYEDLKRTFDPPAAPTVPNDNTPQTDPTTPTEEEIPEFPASN
jgi:hypothetical protein